MSDNWTHDNMKISSLNLLMVQYLLGHGANTDKNANDGTGPLFRVGGSLVSALEQMRKINDRYIHAAFFKSFESNHLHNFRS